MFQTTVHSDHRLSNTQYYKNNKNKTNKQKHHKSTPYDYFSEQWIMTTGSQALKRIQNKTKHAWTFLDPAHSLSLSLHLPLLSLLYCPIKIKAKTAKINLKNSQKHNANYKSTPCDTPTPPQLQKKYCTWLILQVIAWFKEQNGRQLTKTSCFTESCIKICVFHSKRHTGLEWHDVELMTEFLFLGELYHKMLIKGQTLVIRPSTTVHTLLPESPAHQHMITFKVN